jgi:large subunit ribosomal protein L13
MTSTYMQTTAQVDRQWHLLDASNTVLGQLASDIAMMLMGKNRPTYTPHIDSGDFVVVINAEKVVLTGNKNETKMYYNHSLMPGGIKGRNAATLRATKPTELLERAVLNMLPKNRLRDARMGRLKLYAGSEHPHQNHFSAK